MAWGKTFGGRFGRPQQSGAANGARKFKNSIVYWCCRCDTPADVKPCPLCGHADSDTFIVFHSKGERNRWGSLRLAQSLGKIRDLRRQVRFDLKVNVKKIGTYIADFTYYDDRGQWIVEDFKGFQTPLSRRSIKHVQAQYGITVKLTK